LLGSVVPRDAFVSAKLRAAGAIFLGKANLSEWAGMRGKVPNGFSAFGGQTLSPYYPNADPYASSSGSGVATAIGLAAGSLGSETDGSIVFPSSRNNIVGIKPTIGLVSRAGGKVFSDVTNISLTNASCTYLFSPGYYWPDVPFCR
jgi:amidase